MKLNLVKNSKNILKFSRATKKDDFYDWYLIFTLMN